MTASVSQENWLSAEELERVRQNLLVIASNLDGDLDPADPQRLSIVLESVDGLIQYIDDYPQAP